MHTLDCLIERGLSTRGGHDGTRLSRGGNLIYADHLETTVTTFVRCFLVLVYSYEWFSCKKPDEGKILIAAVHVANNLGQSRADGGGVFHPSASPNSKTHTHARPKTQTQRRLVDIHCQSYLNISKPPKVMEDPESFFALLGTIDAVFAALSTVLLLKKYRYRKAWCGVNQTARPPSPALDYLLSPERATTRLVVTGFVLFPSLLKYCSISRKAARGFLGQLGFFFVDQPLSGS